MNGDGGIGAWGWTDLFISWGGNIKSTEKIGTDDTIEK